MFKRDIIVNYGSLDELVRQLDTYVNALNDIRSAVKSIMLKIESGKGLAIEHLKEKDSALVFEIDQVQKEILDLKIIIKNYTEEMTNIIKPVVRSNFMQVDRNDIWINMMLRWLVELVRSSLGTSWKMRRLLGVRLRG